MKPEIVYGDLLKQKVEVIVNSWNRNVIPWWLLFPQGVSGAIKKEGGTTPFKILSKMKPIPAGGARITDAGTLPFKKIIHVAGINLFWIATQYTVSQSVINAMKLVNKHHFESVAFPLIGSGSGNRGKSWSLKMMLDTLKEIETDARVLIVQYEPKVREKVKILQELN